MEKNIHVFNLAPKLLNPRYRSDFVRKMKKKPQKNMGILERIHSFEKEQRKQTLEEDSVVLLNDREDVAYLFPYFRNFSGNFENFFSICFMSPFMSFIAFNGNLFGLDATHKELPFLGFKCFCWNIICYSEKINMWIPVARFRFGKTESSYIYSEMFIYFINVLQLSFRNFNFLEWFNSWKGALLDFSLIQINGIINGIKYILGVSKEESTKLFLEKFKGCIDFHFKIQHVKTKSRLLKNIKDQKDFISLNMKLTRVKDMNLFNKILKELKKLNRDGIFNEFFKFYYENEKIRSLIFGVYSKNKNFYSLPFTNNASEGKNSEIKTFVKILGDTPRTPLNTENVILSGFIVDREYFFKYKGKVIHKVPPTNYKPIKNKQRLYLDSKKRKRKYTKNSNEPIEKKQKTRKKEKKLIRNSVFIKDAKEMANQTLNKEGYNLRNKNKKKINPQYINISSTSVTSVPDKSGDEECSFCVRFHKIILNILQTPDDDRFFVFKDGNNFKRILKKKKKENISESVLVNNYICIKNEIFIKEDAPFFENRIAFTLNQDEIDFLKNFISANEFNHFHFKETISIKIRNFIQNFKKLEFQNKKLDYFLFQDFLKFNSRNWICDNIINIVFKIFQKVFEKENYLFLDTLIDQKRKMIKKNKGLNIY